VVVALVAGWLASRFMKRGGYGFAGDIATGLVGALAGGFLASWLAGAVG
jgi:uncharacterized membrane protein YeaQ/YmgE (transglycosylase-associated protein family)